MKSFKVNLGAVDHEMAIPMVFVVDHHVLWNELFELLEVVSGVFGRFAQELLVRGDLGVKELLKLFQKLSAGQPMFVCPFFKGLG